MIRNDYLLQDSCGNFTVTENNLISPLKGQLPKINPSELNDEIDATCTKCNNKFVKGSVNYRDTRISLTIRYVPVIG